MNNTNSTLTGTQQDAVSLHSRSTAVIAVAVTFLSLTWLAFALRTWVRGVMIRNFGLDDAFMAVTMIVFTLFCVFIILITSSGGGVQVRDVDLPQLPLLVTWLQFAISYYITTMLFFKIAVGIFYLRIAVYQWQKYVVWMVMGGATVYGIAFFFLAIFACGNPTNILAQLEQNQCFSGDTIVLVALIAGIINAVTDWILALLPVSIIIRADMDMRSKISTAAILLLGLLGSVASVVRLTYIDDLRPSPAFFWNAIDLGIWSTIEPGLGIIAACLATLRPLFTFWLDRARVSIGSGLGQTRGSLESESPSCDVIPSHLDFDRDIEEAKTDQSYWNDYTHPRFDFQLRPPQRKHIVTTIIGDAATLEEQGITDEIRRASRGSAYSINTTKRLSFPKNGKTSHIFVASVPETPETENGPPVPPRHSRGNSYSINATQRLSLPKSSAVPQLVVTPVSETPEEDDRPPTPPPKPREVRGCIYSHNATQPLSLPRHGKGSKVFIKPLPQHLNQDMT